MIIVILFLLFPFEFGSAEQAPCPTEPLYKKLGSFGVDLDQETVPHGTKGRLTCNQHSKPGTTATLELVDDPTIECVNGQWQPETLFNCFRGCHGDLLRRTIGSWVLTPKPENWDFIDHDTRAWLTCPDTHYVANRHRAVLVDHTGLQPPTYCLNGQWVPLSYCWEKKWAETPLEETLPPRVDILWHDILDARQEANRTVVLETTTAFITTEFQEQETPATVEVTEFVTDEPQPTPPGAELAVEFVDTSNGVITCELHSDCYGSSKVHAPKEFTCDWDKRKHRWAGGVNYPGQPHGCFCDTKDGEFTVVGSNKCVISRVFDGNTLQWANCGSIFHATCV